MASGYSVLEAGDNYSFLGNVEGFDWMLFFFV
jgi:hypothetical protein